MVLPGMRALHCDDSRGRQNPEGHWRRSAVAKALLARSCVRRDLHGLENDIQLLGCRVECVGSTLSEGYSAS